MVYSGVFSPPKPEPVFPKFSISFASSSSYSSMVFGVFALSGGGILPLVELISKTRKIKHYKVKTSTVTGAREQGATEGKGRYFSQKK